MIFSDSSNQIWNDIQKMCLSVSKMAVKASHLCTVMVESLLGKELNGDSSVEWPNNFNNWNFFVQSFVKGENRKSIKYPVASLDLAWNLLPQKYSLSLKYLYDGNIFNAYTKTI